MVSNNISLRRSIEKHVSDAKQSCIQDDEARHVYVMTDFGNADLSALPMVGVINSVAKHATCVVAPQLPAFQTETAAFLLEVNHPAYFRAGSIFCVVVDPGVGTERHPVAILANDHYYVGPDNGVFARVVTRDSFQCAARLDDPSFYLHPDISDTFHGIDIFAPVSGHLASGTPILCLGTEISFDDLYYTTESQIGRDGELSGQVMLVDDFGSLVIDITESEFSLFTNESDFEIILSFKSEFGVNETYTVSRVVKTFDDGRVGEVVALFGGDFISLEGHPYMTMAVNMGSAADITGAKIGDQVSVVRV